MVPFDVPAGTTQVRVRDRHDQPDAPALGVSNTTRPRPVAACSGRRRAVDDQGVPRVGRLATSGRPGLAAGLPTAGPYFADPRGRAGRRAASSPADPARPWAAELARVGRQPGSGRRRRHGRWRVETELSLRSGLRGPALRAGEIWREAGSQGPRLVRGRHARARRALQPRRRHRPAGEVARPARALEQVRREAGIDGDRSASGEARRSDTSRGAGREHACRTPSRQSSRSRSRYAGSGRGPRRGRTGAG